MMVWSMITVKEVAEKWGVSETWVTILCKQGRVNGVTKEHNRWLIPDDAEKPEDRRKQNNVSLSARFTFVDLFA